MRFAIMGAGKVGTALARLLSEAGYEFVGAASRTLESAENACRFAGGGRASTDPAEVTRSADLVLITVPDDAIRTVCEELAEHGAIRQGAVVAHCNGALPSTILEGARTVGAHVGSLHPMQSFASAEQALRILPGSTCCVEGDEEAVLVLEEVARSLSCDVVTIATEAKPLYHAAGCAASNYLVAVQELALKLAAAAGIERTDAMQVLLPLVKGTVENFERLGSPACLTGPIARGDVETVRRHLQAIEDEAPDLLELYKVLGLQTVQIGLAKGSLSPQCAAELKRLLTP